MIEGEMKKEIREAYLRGREDEMENCGSHRASEQFAHQIIGWNAAIDKAAEWIDNRMARSQIGEIMKKELKRV